MLSSQQLIMFIYRDPEGLKMLMSCTGWMASSIVHTGSSKEQAKLHNPGKVLC